MNNYIVYSILELKYYIIFSMAVLVAETAGVLLLMGIRKSGIARFGVQGFFLGRTKRQLLYVTFGVSELVFVVSMLFGRVHMMQCQIGLLLLLILGRCITQMTAGSVIAELIFGVLTGAALVAENLLSDYLSQTGFDFYIFAVWLLLAVFITGYTVYHQLKSIERMLESYEIRKEKRRIRGSRKAGRPAFFLRKFSGGRKKKPKKEAASA